MFALAAYRGVARELLLAFKERGRRDLAGVLGALLAVALPLLPDVPLDAWVVPAPSRRAASRRRGGSHVVGLARASGWRVSAALRFGPGVRESVGLDARARTINVAGRVLLARSGLPPPGATVVLLDDVVTTGATASACTSALKAAGFRVPAVLTLTATRGPHPRG
ncbi:phosphoribosyltransferase [Actinosynnema sp. NPDC020468]|uniref:ComF family protein n=1 Tax=Actinosynnema sp. NPDC020468 TaxID=3154488 RepID=UPI0033E4F5F6